jgi:RNA polymerase sigma factor (sigma-70 family)
MSAEGAQPAPPDEALIRGFLDGDEAAFRSLYRRHAPRLRMLVLRLVGYRDTEADDVLQETWLAGCRALRGFRGDARFGTWLTTIAIRTARRRMGWILDAPVALDDGEIEELPHPGRPVDAAIDAERVLQGLPERDRIVFTLRYLEGFTHEEIARELGIAIGTSRAILSRSLTQIRAHYRTKVTHDV